MSEIRRQDVVIQRYKAPGPGGQHKNKTETAIRMKHLPTGIVVTSANERSLSFNLKTAWKLLQGALARREEEARAKQLSDRRKARGNLGFGAEYVRSYRMMGADRITVDGGILGPLTVVA